jgi:peptidoglycan/xylan/chitin deacetylase (PgdA/CDA1 family)
MTMPDIDPASLFPYSPIVDRPPVTWPNGATLAVWVIPNIEHYKLGGNAPDVRSFARRDYGNRVGIWRLMEVLAKHGVRGTVALNGEVVTRYPRVMEEAVKLGWELMGHGFNNSTMLPSLSPDEEVANIDATKNAIAAHGRRMRGWLSPALRESWNTLDFLQKAGVDYVCDWVNDDLPYRMNSGIFSIPYTTELNDYSLFSEPSISIDDFEKRIRDSCDTLREEGEKKGGRVMAIALHPFLIGVPHRIKYLDRALQYIAGQDKIWFATGSEIIDAFRAQTKT